MVKLLRKYKKSVGRVILASLMLSLLAPCLAVADDDHCESGMQLSQSLDQDNAQNNFDKNAKTDLADIADSHCHSATCMKITGKIASQTINFSAKSLVFPAVASLVTPHDYLLGLFRPPQA